MEAILLSFLANMQHPTFQIGLVATSIAAIGIKKARQSAREKNSIDFETTYKTNEKLNAAWDRSLPLMLHADSKTIENISKNNTCENYKAINLILNTWERAANGIAHRVYDGEFLYKTYGTTVIELHQRLYPFIKSRQAKNPRFFLELTKLYICWKIKRQAEDKTKSAANLKTIYKQLEKASELQR